MEQGQGERQDLGAAGLVKQPVADERDKREGEWMHMGSETFIPSFTIHIRILL